MVLSFVSILVGTLADLIGLSTHQNLYCENKFELTPKDWCKLALTFLLKQLEVNTSPVINSEHFYLLIFTFGVNCPDQFNRKEFYIKISGSSNATKFGVKYHFVLLLTLSHV